MTMRPRDPPTPEVTGAAPSEAATDPIAQGSTARGSTAAVPLSDDRGSAAPVPFIARWDLDKTYLRTDFDTVRDLWSTLIQRPDQKRTVPGAAALLRELGRAGVAIHILSGSPEQLRSRIEAKLRLDGARWASLTLKPNLQNLLRLRFRALRGQLGYKLPALLHRRCELRRQHDESGALIREVLLGDDAEADAFVYSLYADVCRGRIDTGALTALLRAGGAYEDTITDAVRFASYVDKGPVVERILIHLDRQSSPSDFKVYGDLVVPFYNYLQASFVLYEDGRIPARSVLRIAQDLTASHNFDGSALARSYLDLSRRGHVSGKGVPEIVRAYGEHMTQRRAAGASEVGRMVSRLEDMLTELTPPVSKQQERTIDYGALLLDHNRRAKR